MSEKRKLGLIAAVFAAAWWLPIDSPRVQGALLEAFAMLHDYAREHVLLCLVPAFFIAGGISVFVSQASVMKTLILGYFSSSTSFWSWAFTRGSSRTVT